MRKKEPILTLFCGLPGSGKTTLAKKLEEQGKGIRICTDDWQEALGMNHDNEDFHGVLQKALYQHAMKLLGSGVDVILEDGLWMKNERDEKLSDAKSVGATTEIHFFDLSFDELWRRMQSRNQDLPFGAVEITKDDLQKCWDIFEKPSPEELGQFGSYEVHQDDSKCHENR